MSQMALGDSYLHDTPTPRPGVPLLIDLVEVVAERLGARGWLHDCDGTLDPSA